MKSFGSLFIALSASSALSTAIEPGIKEETASVHHVLVRPGDGGIFKEVLEGFREEGKNVRPFEWKEVDEKIDKWFADAETRFPEDFKNHAADWKELREQSKRDARVTVAAVEADWKKSQEEAAAEFEKSEAEFYARKPAFLIRGTYRYREGQREPSAVNPSWVLENAKPLHFKPIKGEEIRETGDITLKAAGLGHPMFSLRCGWTLLIEASIDTAAMETKPIGSINTASIRAWMDPTFEGKTDRKVTQTWVDFDKSSIPVAGPVRITIGNPKITTSMSIGGGFSYSALGHEAPYPELHAGTNEPAPED